MEYDTDVASGWECVGIQLNFIFLNILFWEPIIHYTDMVNFPDLNIFLTYSLLTGQVELSMLKVKLIQLLTHDKNSVDGKILKKQFLGL